MASPRKAYSVDKNNNQGKGAGVDENRLKRRSANIHHLYSDGVSSDEESITYGGLREDKSDASIDEDLSDCADETSYARQREEETSVKQGSESKPTQSYIALIAKAILSKPERKMVLSDIYKYILENYPFYKTQDKSWRNSIRHNLSLNECFVKAGRSENGKGNYWAVHPSNEEDFAKGDYRRRRTRRKAKRPAHPFGFYSDFCQPYAMLPPFYRHNGKTVPYIWSASEGTFGTNEKKITRNFSQQKPRKSFTIDSILGLDEEKKTARYTEKLRENIELYADTLRSHNAARRHHSWSTSPYSCSPRSPTYERSAFSPVSTHQLAESYSLLPDYYRRLETTQYRAHYIRDTIQELSRLRKSFS